MTLTLPHSDIATTVRKDIRKLSPDELKAFFTSHGEPAFRAKQVHEWLWKKSATDFDRMTNLPASLREFLKIHFVINLLTVESKQISSDQTIKSAFRLHDGNLIEGVLIPHDDRMTACVSSQVGCSLTCKFCATGYMDRKRNLEAAEIYDQVVLIKRAGRRTVRNAPHQHRVHGHGRAAAQLRQRAG